jgi:Ca-activated chloride channel family protein
MKSFTQQEESSKALIIITDGENHEDNAMEAASAAVEKGITVHTIGIGLPKGAPIPLYSGGQRNYLKDNAGETVISKLDETMLQQIAAAGEGVYIRSTDTRVGLDKLFDEINKMEKQEMEALVYSDYDERFQYLFGIGLFFLLLEFFILERKNKWLSKIKLFDLS